MHSYMSRRSFLATSAITAAGCSFPSLSHSQISKANIVFIMADDLGYGDLSCYGAPDLKTPNLDAMAAQGVRMTDYYAAAPVCTPTRCALMTGRYQQRVKNLEWAIYPGIKTVGLPPEETTIATVLQQAGYRTALFGKWHLGYQAQNHPMNHGFDEFFGILSGNVDYFRHTESNDEHDLYEGKEPVHREGYITDQITQRSVEFIQSNAEEPFFLYVSYNAPHFPYQGPDDAEIDIGNKNWGSTGNRETYIHMVERMDQGIGQILAELKEQGLEENTFVVFCSDNGGDRYSRNAPLSGKKATLREGGIRVPCILRWPRILPKEMVSRQSMITMDLSVMILAAANVRPVRHMDGFNLFPFICGEREDIVRTFLWRNNWHNEKAVRWGDWKWHQKDGQDSLYFLPEDIAEEKNIATNYSDIVHGIKTIHGLWEKAMKNNQTVFGPELRNLDPPTY